MRPQFLFLALLLAAAFPRGASALDAVGPPMGNNRYRATISGAEDKDEFTGRFLRGDVLTVAVSAVGKGKAPPSLRPVLTLVDPDGLVRTSGIVAAPGGSSSALKGFALDKSGLWAARVAGADGTSGDFVVSFRTRAAPRQVLTVQRVGGDQPNTRAYDVPGFPGAILDATVTWSARSQPVAFTDLRDPTGAEVPGRAGGTAIQAARRKGRSATLKGVALSGGSGNYSLRVGVPMATAQYTLTIAVRNPSRVSSPRQRTLAAAEPALDPVQEPLLASAGGMVRFTGTGFSTARPPKVLFGSTAATAVSVGAGGSSMDVLVPARTSDAVVPVYVSNADGQGMGREHYFCYLPAPSITDLVDDASGAPVRVSPALGGRLVRLLGANFEGTHTIRVGGVAVKSPSLPSSSAFRFTMPAVPDGDRAVEVTDLYSRRGVSAFTVRYKTPPAFAADPYTPGAVRLDTPTGVTIRGTSFEAADRLFLAGQEIPSVWGGATTRTFDVPALGAGTYAVRLVDSIGTVVDGPALVAKGAPAISAVTVVGGASLGSNQVPLAGGSRIRIDGTDFGSDDTVTVGGVAVKDWLVRTATRKEFVAPAGTAGPAGVTVTDAASQAATFDEAIRYVGFDDVSWRTPSPDATDDWSAVRGASADLDGDGLRDDLVVVSPLWNRPGSQARQTRVLLGDGQGALVDGTADAIPAAYSDPAGLDCWDATCVAIGDLDLSGSPDIVLGGEVSGGTPAGQVRLLRNDGGGAFTLESDAVESSRSLGSVWGTYGYYGYTYAIYGNSTQRGVERALALGDLDLDGDLDVVAGADLSQSRAVYLDPRYVDFSTSPPTIQKRLLVNYQQYLPALRILRNDLPQDGGTLHDVSAEVLPAAGHSFDAGTLAPALHARDVALGDVNGDGAPDVVVAWDDPLTVTHFGQATFESTGASQDGPRVATRILLNSTTSPGTFTDGTTAWLPVGSGAEHWQADRVALGDLDGDGDLDLVLSASKGLDAWLGAPSHTLRALRILRNDGTKFTDVSAAAVPAVDAAASEDWRSDAVLLRDVDGDGRLDLLAATTATLVHPSYGSARRLRYFRGIPGAPITFHCPTEFQTPLTDDTGDASDLVISEDLAGPGSPVLLLLGETCPSVSPGGRWLRAQEWRR